MEWKKELWPEWKVEELIGTGAYGQVYKIKRQDLGGTYYSALKVISYPSDNSVISFREMDEKTITQYYHNFIQEVAKEFAMMEKLKGHTNIVSYEDHKITMKEDGSGWYILIRMELLTPLNDYLKEHGYVEEDCMRMAMDICNALILCQRTGIIHKDIKPGNLFVSEYGDYKLGDFSLAESLSEDTINMVPQGTYMFMAPEVYGRRGYNTTIDLYSLGLILYMMMNDGRAPFLPEPPTMLDPEMKERANLRRLYGEPFPKPRHASAAFASVIMKACSYSPQDRYQTAEEMLRAVERCMESKKSLPRQVMSYLKEIRMSSEEDVKKEPQKVEVINGKSFFKQAGDL